MRAKAEQADLVRCPWIGIADPIYARYHDEEWGVPKADDRALFEKLVLEGFQAGLSWLTILKKRENFRGAFHGFEPERENGDVLMRRCPFRDLAEELVRLGVVTGMALDGGGSTTMAFDGRVLNRPSDGSERPVADALMFMYYGIHAPKPRYAKFSPNADGVADVQSLSAKIVRPSTVDLVLVQPDGAVAWRYAGPLQPSTVRKNLTSPLLPEGKWRWIAYALDDRGRESLMEHSFRLNNTLGFISVQPSRVTVRKKRGGRLLVGFTLTRPARVSVSITSKTGQLLRVVRNTNAQAGKVAVLWNGKYPNGKPVFSGTYVARVVATNSVGRAELARSFQVRRAR